MTDKTAEIHLKQLTTALEFLAASWDNAAGELTRYPESRSKEDNIAAVNLYGAFTQTSMTLRLLLDSIRELPADASEDDIKKAASHAFAEAGDVWD